MGQPIGPSERRMRALMSVPQKTRLNSQEGATMLLIAATTVTPGQLEAGVRAMLGAGARDGDAALTGQLRAALSAMGFEYENDRLQRHAPPERAREPRGREGRGERFGWRDAR